MNKINKMKKRFIFLAVVLFLFIVPYISSSSVSSLKIDSQIFEKLNENQDVSVIVMLRDGPVSSPKGLSILGKPGKTILEQKKAMIKDQQDNVLSRLNLKDKTKNLVKSNARDHVSTTSSGADFNLRHKYSTVNGFSGMVTKSGLEKLRNNPDVKKVYLDRVVHAFLDQSIPQINADDTWAIQLNSTNITGLGETICIIDTGIDYNHSALGNGWGNKTIGGYNAITQQECAINNSACFDDKGHGTHCAGIAASNDTIYRGVAPDAKLIAIKVLDSSGSGWNSDVIAGIDWCTNNASKFNISVISMSLGITGTAYNNTYCDTDYSDFADAINSAVGAGILVAVSSGNCEEVSCTAGISVPSCVENATPVGAVDSTDTIDYQRGDILNLLAPGKNIYSTIPGGWGFKTGTSMATPHVAGAAALLKQFVRLYNGTDITPQEIEDVLNDTGVQIYDGATGRTYSRIDVYAAILSLDTTAPELNFVSPTPENNTNTSNTSIFINVTTNEILSSILLDWNGTNETMNGSGLNFYLNKTITGSGNFIYKVYGNDSANNTGVSETRIITINNTAPTQPSLTNPANQSIQTTINITINWSTSTDANGDTINYFIHFLNSSPPTYNSSTQDLYKTFTDLTDNETYYWYIIANDGTANTTSAQRQFTINTTALTVTFVPPTPRHNVRQIKNYIYVNVTVIHSSLNISNCTLLWNDGINSNISMEKVGNGTSVSCFKNMTTIDGINYTYSVIANTTDGVEGTTGNRTNLENTKPQLNISYLGNNSNITTTSTYLNWSSSDAEGDNITHYVYGNSTRNSILLSLYNGTDLNYNWQIDDGTYYWYVVANDSYETNTSSEYKFNVNISPVLSGLSLSSASGYSDTNITVYVNCSDTGSNISSVTVSVYYPNTTWVNYSMASLNETQRYTKSYRPNIVGTYNFSFYCQDYYGNIAVNETTGLQFTSSTRPSPSSGGGRGGTPIVSYEQKSVGTLAAGSSKAVAFTKSATFAVTEIKVTVRNKVTNAKIKVDTGSLPSGASLPSAKGSVYKYIEITKTGMTDSDVSKGIIKFKVKRSWLTDKGYGKNTIALHRYYNNKWTKLTTTRDSQDTTYYYYCAESPGFSAFAITAEKAPVITAPAEEPEEEEPEEAEVTKEEVLVEEEAPAQVEAPEEEKEAPSNTTLIVTLIAVIIVFVIVSYFVQEKKQKKKKEYKKEKKKKHKRKRG